MDNLGDISELLSPLLNDPDAMEKIRGAAQQMGLGHMLDGGEPTGGSASESAASAEHDGGAMNADLLQMMGKIAPLLQRINSEDDTTRLLHALEPFLGQERRGKLDEIAKMMGIIRMISALKDVQ